VDKALLESGVPDNETATRVTNIKDIPGTTVFDSTQCRMGYHLNMCCMSLLKAENREKFKTDEAAYLEKFPMSTEQRQAVLARDYNHMIRLGGNIYYLGKLAAIDGHSFQKLASMMTGIPEDEFRKTMMAGGRSIHAVLNNVERKNHG
jgi:protocatechuate 4,5-dioxygenase alpha chain